MNPITREESLLDGQDLTPITRKEQFIKRIYDKTQEIPEPITREEYFLKKAGEGTSPVTIEQLNVTENGTYSETGKAYSPVIVDVPAPTLITKTITENGTYNASSDNADGYSQVTVDVDGFKKKSIANTPTAIASFNDGTANPMPSLEISIEPVQSGSGDPSPSNVRPISGWSGAKVADDAVYGGVIDFNQLLPFDSDSYSLPIGLSVNITNGRMVISGTATSTTTSTMIPSRMFNTIRPINAHKYLINVNGAQNFNAFRFSIYGDTIQDINLSTMTSKIFNCSVANATEAEFIGSVTEGIDYSADFITYLIDLTQLFGTTIADYIYSLEQATAGAGVAYFRNLFPHDYYPYNAGEITTVSAVNGDVDKYSITSIPFHDSSDNPITVYGGTLNVTSGELTATHIITDLGIKSYTQTAYGSNTIFYCYIGGCADIPSNQVADALCSCYVMTSNDAIYDGTDKKVAITKGSSDPYAIVRIANSDYTDVTAFTQSLSNQKLVYPLATPQTYQLTPTQVSTLLGQNNIFADCGQILEGEYFVTL